MWQETPAKPSPFTEMDLYVEPDSDEWRLTIMGQPDNELIARDWFVEEDLAVARADDFCQLVRKHWPDVRVNRHFPRSRPGLVTG